MKVMKKMSIIHSLGTAKHIKCEREILELIQGKPFLICLQYAFQDYNCLYLVMDYVRGGELYRRLACYGPLTEPEVCLYVAELVVALEQLHSRNVIYRDLKLENVLIDDEGHIVLADFGLTTILKPEHNYRSHAFCGTVESMAPEVIQIPPEGYCKPVDWWGVGILTAELLSGHNPFAIRNNMKPHEIEYNILNRDPLLPAHLSPRAADFIRKLLDKNPNRRLGGWEIRMHPFFARINWTMLSMKGYYMPFVPDITAIDDFQHFD
ncbi:hypothetical protein KR200_006807, partial [Drosophila serrata]